MNVRTRSAARLLIMTMTLAALVILPATAALGYAPEVDDSFLTCVPGEESGQADCTAGKCDPGQPANVQVNDGELFDDTVVADEDGDVNFMFEFDPETTDEDFKVDVNCQLNGQPQVLGVVLEKDAVLADVIAAAGASSTTLVGIALGALALGAGALLVTRRRGTIDA